MNRFVLGASLVLALGGCSASSSPSSAEDASPDSSGTTDGSNVSEAADDTASDSPRHDQTGTAPPPIPT